MAHTPRVYIDHPLSVGSPVALPPGTCKHLISVLRLRTGDAVELFNGDGSAYSGSLTVGKKDATAAITASRPGPPTGTPLTLALGVSRGDRMDYALQKSTELGVAQIQPLWTERCSVKIPADRIHKKMQHWRHVMISASEQCGRCDIPTLNEVTPLQSWLEQTQPGFVLSPEAAHPLSSHPAADSAAQAVLIGPESGLSERDVAMAADAGWQLASLGPLVLRTETAAAVAMTVLRQQHGML